MSFNFNFVSNSPATPNRKSKNSLFSQAPSTTPAGPPPSHLTNFSTTPAGNPPRSSKIFGSSINAAPNTFGRKGGFAVPESSPPPNDEDFDEDEDADGEDDVDIWAPQKSSIMAESPQRGLKRSRDGQVREREGSGMVEIAKAMARDSGPPQRLEEGDDVVLGSEEILAGLDVKVHQQRTGMMEGREESITSATAELAKLWGKHSDAGTKLGAIGPEANDAMTKSTYLSTLLLQLHGPYTTRPAQQPHRSGKSLILASQQTAQTSSIPLPRALLDWLNTYHNPLPDDFQEIHLHRPSSSAHESFWDLIGAELLRGRFSRVIRLLKDAGFQNAFTAHIDNNDNSKGYSGKQLDAVEEVVGRCIHVLEACPAVTDGDWNVAGADWELFRQRVRHAIKDLEAYATANAAPPAQDETSNNMFSKVTNMSMTAATQRAASRVPPTILDTLKMLYGVLLGGNGILDFAQDWLEGAILLTVWWDGEDNSAALDASLADLRVSHAARKSLRQSRRGGAAGGVTREVDVAPLAAYKRRLAHMFASVTEEVDEPAFQPDSLDPVHVGLACVMEDSVDSALGLLRTWSPTLSTAVVELAALGGWLPQARPSSRGFLGRERFSSEDLMVLSHGAGDALGQNDGRSQGIDRDALLTSYADLLASKAVFHSSDGSIEREDWDLAVSVLSRLDDTEAAQERIRAVLERIDIKGEARLEKVLQVCQGMGFGGLGRGIAERYANSLADQALVPYGSALIYYARAHATKQLHATLSLLIDLCLLQSAAMPPRKALDPQLQSLLSTQRAALVGLAKVDAEAAGLMGRSLSGYATLRRFYELRDQGADESSSRSSKKMAGPLERKREAAKALTAVVESARDPIRGGLFDPAVESVVPVEGLLVLLGEALPLLGQGKRVFETKDVLGLMGVVEDFEAVSERIQQNAEGLFKASLNAYRGTVGGGGLGKSRGNLSGSSGMLGSGSWEELAESSFVMLNSNESARSAGSAKSNGKAATFEVQRGWDWRKGIDAVAATGADVGRKEVLMLLRTALAREVARGWGGGWE